MTNNVLRENLISAKALIADFDRWAQGAGAYDVNGNICDPRGATAYSLCATEACCRINLNNFYVMYLALDKASQTLYATKLVPLNEGWADSSIYTGINPDKKRAAHTAILKVFDYAIEHAEIDNES